MIVWTYTVTNAGNVTLTGIELAETLEVLNRGWNIDGMSVRPDHRMVAHTGFLTHARLLPTPD